MAYAKTNSAARSGARKPQADQCLCFLFMDPTAFLIRNFQPLAIVCVCAAQFVSDLVGNHEFGFSHAAALIYSLLYLSLVMRKPDFCICENKDADQLRGNREADQRLCFRHMDSAIPLLSKLLAICGCTARFVCDLVGYPEDRFSHNEAHFMSLASFCSRPDCILPSSNTTTQSTVKFLNFWTPENFTVICLKFKQRGQTLGYFVK